MNKNQFISDTLKATRERRKNQECKVFELKVDKSSLSEITLRSLDRLFLEAKWFYNYSLSRYDILIVDYKQNYVWIKTKNDFEIRKLLAIGSQLKQSILKQLHENVISLSLKKKKGQKIGKLKFKNNISTIDLPQFSKDGKTGCYRIKNKGIKIQNIKQYLKVNGIEQLTEYEIANAKFIRRHDDFYFHISCFRDKQVIAENKHQIGLDFGIKNQLTLSNGIELNYHIYVASKVMRRCMRRLSKKKYQSKNWYKEKTKLEKLFSKTTNQKHDIKNKILNILKTEYGLIAFQNDNLQGWQHIWGKRMLNTSIGGIMSNLKRLPTAVEVDRWFASTKECPKCKKKQNINLSERIFKCDCGYEKQRDWKSADCILDEAIVKIGAECTELTSVERKTHTLIVLNRLKNIPHVKASLLVEAESHCNNDSSHSSASCNVVNYDSTKNHKMLISTH